MVAGVVEATGVAERTLKRRFKATTGSTIIAYARNLRVEEAKRRLETTDEPSDEIAVAVGYENPVFFRRLFKRYSGLTPG
ncbi:MAG: helix-turn-helix domain-containing protein [Reyranella sp.]|uniref:helix-turn-helix domain-containing protein n=1 Tax=Reyranella sp. TaxID=1929291 RepID=UPI003D0F61F6